MQFTAQGLRDLSEARTHFAALPLDEAQSARIHTLQQRIERSAALQQPVTSWLNTLDLGLDG